MRSRKAILYLVSLNKFADRPMGFFHSLFYCIEVDVIPFGDLHIILKYLTHITIASRGYQPYLEKSSPTCKLNPNLVIVEATPCTKTATSPKFNNASNFNYN